MKCKYLFLISFLLLPLLLISCTTEKDTIIQTSSEEIKIFVEIADSMEERALGLMYRTSLEEDQGMLFVFEDTKERIFWMKNTKIPLDILFLDENGTIVDIKENFVPCIIDPCEHYYSKPTMYALEVNAGFIEKHGIAIGNTLLIEKK